MGEGPALTAEIARAMHLNAHFFGHFPVDGGLDRFAGFQKACQGAVASGRKIDVAGQQQLVTAGDQHHHGGRDARVVAQAAAGALHGTFARHAHGRHATGAAPTVGAHPFQQLAGLHGDGGQVVRQAAEPLAQALGLPAGRQGRRGIGQRDGQAGASLVAANALAGGPGVQQGTIVAGRQRWWAVTALDEGMAGEQQDDGVGIGQHGPRRSAGGGKVVRVGQLQHAPMPKT